MSERPVAEVDARFSMEGATATDWGEASGSLEKAELFWLSTVRPDGRPHVTPLIAVWAEDALHFCTGPTEQKARNLVKNAHVTLTTGTNALHEGLDVVVEGDAVQVTDRATLQRIADAYESKYGAEWHFDVGDGVFVHDAGEALVYEVAPAKALGFRKGDYSQTRWRFVS